MSQYTGKHKNCKYRVNQRRRTVLAGLEAKEVKTAKDQKEIETLKERIKNNDGRYVARKNAYKKKKSGTKVEVRKDDYLDGFMIGVYSVSRVSRNKKDRYTKKKKGKKTIKVKKKAKYAKALIKRYDPRKYAMHELRSNYKSSNRQRYVIKLERV